MDYAFQRLACSARAVAREMPGHRPSRRVLCLRFPGFLDTDEGQLGSSGIRVGVLRKPVATAQCGPELAGDPGTRADIVIEPVER